MRRGRLRKFLVLVALAIAVFASSVSASTAAARVQSAPARAVSLPSSIAVQLLRTICVLQGGQFAGAPLPMQCNVALTIPPGGNLFELPGFAVIDVLCRSLGFRGVFVGGKGLPTGGFGIGAWWCFTTL
jgi:hypothetical protein